MIHSMDPDGQNSQTTSRGFPAILCMFFGMVLFLGYFDIGPLTADRVNGPTWLELAAGGVFLGSGLALLFTGRGELWRGIAALLTTVSMAAIVNWIAFGAGERVCSGSISLPFFGRFGAYRDLACRIPFGFAAVVVDAVLLLALANFLQKSLGGPPRLRRLVSLSQGLLLLTLAPLLLPLLLFLIVKGGFSAVKSRLSSGAWPRNRSFLRRRSGPEPPQG